MQAAWGRSLLDGRAPDANLYGGIAERKSKASKTGTDEEQERPSSMSTALRRNRLSTRRFAAKRDRGLSIMDRIRATIYSARGSTDDSRRSTMHIKNHVRRPRERRPKLAKKSEKKFCQDWAHRSMLHHVGTFITVLFLLFSITFLFYLYGAAVAYEARLVSEIENSFEIEAKLHMDSVIN